MFYTLTIDGRDQIFEPHNNLDDAERFARDVASNGFNCTVMQVLSVVEAVEQPYQNPAQLRGVIPGRDFPATL